MRTMILTLSILLAGMMLAGCVQHPPAITADAVLSAQYAARSSHGVMTGAEAAAVADALRRDIAHPLAAAPDFSTP